MRTSTKLVGAALALAVGGAIATSPGTAAVFKVAAPAASPSASPSKKATPSPVPQPTNQAAITPKPFTVYATQKQRNTIPVNSKGVSVGDLVIGSGVLGNTAGAAKRGTFTFRSETVVVPDTPGAPEQRQATAFFKLKKGTILTQGLMSITTGTVPTTAQTYIIVGGTGKFVGARGTMTYTPTGENTSTATFSFVG